MEPFAIALKKNVGIKGIQHGDMYKVLLHADNMLSVISNPLLNLPKLLDLLKEFVEIAKYTPKMPNEDMTRE